MSNQRLDKLLEMEAKQPADAFLKFAIALEYMSLGRVEAAGGQFALLLKDFPQYLPTYYQAGKFYEEQGETARAAGAYREGIELATANGDTKTLRELKEALTLLEDE